MSSRIALLICAASVTYGLGGCASEGPAPSDALTRARTMIDQADKAQGQRYAAADLQRAHDELSQAESAEQKEHYREARMLAESAAVDADVTMARADAGDAQRAAREAAQSNAALEQESQRASDATNAAVAGSVPPPPQPPPPAPPPPLDSYPQAPPATPDNSVPR